MTLGIMAFSIITPRIMSSFLKLSISNTEYYDTQHYIIELQVPLCWVSRFAECHYSECHYAVCSYAQCRYAECCGAFRLCLTSVKWSSACNAQAVHLCYPLCVYFYTIIPTGADAGNTNWRGRLSMVDLLVSGAWSVQK